MSILSKEPDGAGFFYGFHESDPRRIDLRLEPTFETRKNQTWFAYVGGNEINGGNGYSSAHEAEAAAIAFLKTGRRT